MKSFAAYPLIGVSLIALATPMQAMAQEATAGPATATAAPGDEADDSALDDTIVVQARRRDEALQDVPLSVQAVTGNQLSKLEIRSFQDVAAVVPGLQLQRASNGIQNTVTMRGISFNPVSTGPQTAVELYRNDVVTTSTAIFQALYDIQQIEVLRGPQGTLRGRASPSGSITITTRRPNLQEVGGFVEGVVAEEGKYNLVGAVNFPIWEDKLGVRFSGYKSGGRGGDVDGRNLFTGAVDDDVHDRTESYRASVRADPFDGVLVLDFNYEETHRDTVLFEQYESRSLAVAGAPASPVTISSGDRLGIQIEPNTTKGRFKFYNWQAQLSEFGQKLTYVGGHLNALTRAVAPEDFGGILRNEFALSATADVNGVINTNQFAQLTRSHQKQNVHEIRLQNEERIADIFDYVVGYLNLKSNTPTTLYTPTSACVGGGANCAVGGLMNVTYGGVYRIRSDKEESVFGNITAHIGDSTEFSGGVRRIKFSRISGLQSATRNAVGVPAPDRQPVEQIRALPQIASFAVDDGVKHTIFTLSAKHKFTDDLMAYATYGTSFRPGNIVVCSRCNAAEGTILNAGGFLAPEDEKSKSVEAGIKASLLDKRVTANLSVFRQTFKNFTVGAAEPVQFLNNLNPPTLAIQGTTNNLVAAVPVRITGFEAELGFRPSPRFNIAANIAYADSKVRGAGRVPCLDVNNDGFQDTALVQNTPAGRAAFAAGISPPGGFVDTCPISKASPAPKWSATAQSEYNLPVNDNIEGFLRGLLSYAGKTSGDDVNPVDSVKSYATLNLYLGVRDADGGWDVSAFVKNLTDTNRVLTRTGSLASSVIANVIYPSTYSRITTLSPREFGVTARFSFGSR